MKGMGGKDWAVKPRREIFELHVDPILLFHTDRQEIYHCSLETGIISVIIYSLQRTDVISGNSTCEAHFHFLRSCT
jgi:hypothetical protein